MSDTSRTQIEPSRSAHHSPSAPRSVVSPRGEGVLCPLLPTEDRVILEDVDAPPPSTLLTIIEDRPSYRGKVVAVGPEVQDLTVGDVVQYRPFVGARIEVDGVSWMLVREDECVCKLG